MIIHFVWPLKQIPDMEPRFLEYQSTITGIYWSSDNQHFLTTAIDLCPKLWHASSGRCVWTAEDALHDKYNFSHVKFSGESPTIFTTEVPTITLIERTGNAFLLDALTGKCLKEWRAFDSRADCIARVPPPEYFRDLLKQIDN